MLDLLGFPLDQEPGNLFIQRFANPCTVDNTQWQPWSRPRGVSMLMIICVGGGGGGGGGDGDLSSFGRPGGAGGGSSGITRVIVCLNRLPRTLYIQVGAGGAGGVPSTLGVGGTSGGTGLLSYVAIAPTNTTVLNILAVSAAVGAIGGGGSTGGNPTGGAAATAAVIGSMPLAQHGFFNSLGGQAGANGGLSNANGSPGVIPSTGALCFGGTGGGGVTVTNRSGGGWTAIAGSYLSQQAPAAQGPGAVNGAGGLEIWKPMAMFGGGGGGGSTLIATAVGGDGVYGSGGGGGGAALTTGGGGGAGGGGFVEMVAWG